MEGLILIAVIWFIVSSLKKGVKKSTGSGNPRAGEWAQRPNPVAPKRPLTPERPAIPQGWSEILTMLTEEPSSTEPQIPGEEGVHTENSERSGSLTEHTILEGAPTMLGEEGVFTEYSERSGSLTEHTILEGAPTMMGDESVDYEGRDLPDERPAFTLSVTPGPVEPTKMPAPARAARLSPTALREAVVWSEILGKPKALRRAVR